MGSEIKRNLGLNEKRHNDSNNIIPNNTKIKNQGSPDALYSALISMKIHQDNLLWSRVQILIAIQGAVITGSYFLRTTWISYLLLLNGIFLTILLIFLVSKDQNDRDSNNDLVNELGIKLIPKDINKRVYKKYIKLSYIPFSTKYKWKNIPIKGGFIIGLVLWTFVVLDILLLFLYIFFLNIFP